MKTKLTIIIGMFFVGYAIGCQSDFGCPMGSSCIQPGGPWSEGICSGQNFPVPQPVQQFPVPSFNRPEVQVQECSTNFQCGFGHSCVKWGNNYMGVCR